MPNPNGKNNCLLTDPVKTGEWLSKVLKEHNILEHELAHILGVSYARMMNWVTGKRGMRLYMIMAICAIVETNKDYRGLRMDAMHIFQELKS